MVMMTQKDLNILSYYSDNKDRIGYWNYLSSINGSDNYGRLALSVVRNDNVPGSVANHYAENYAKEKNINLSPEEWEKIGYELVQKDFQARFAYFQSGETERAVNLPASEIENYHVEVYESNKLDGAAWTPKVYLIMSGEVAEMLRTRGETC